MNQNGLSMRIGGVPVQVQPFFVVVVALLAFSAGRTGWLIPAFMALAFVSVLIHELGHAAAFRRYGRNPHVVLHGFGGYTAAPGSALEPKKNLVVSLAGSLTQMALLGIPAVWALRAGVGEGTDLRTVLFDLAWVSIGWGVLNLIPLLPLDGGQVMVALIDLAAPGRGQRAGHMISIGVAVVGLVLAVQYGLLFGAIFAAMFAGQNLQALQATKDHVDGQALTSAYASLRRGDSTHAVGEAEAVLGKKSTPRPRALAVELLAWERLFADDPGGSTEVLRRLPDGAVPSEFYRGCLELAVGRQAEAMGLLASAFSKSDGGGSLANLAARYVAERDQVATLATHLSVHDAQAAGLDTPRPGGGLRGLVALQASLHFAEHFEQAAVVGSQVYAGLDAPRHRSTQDRAACAYNIACSLSRAGHHATASQWLVRAIDDGLPDPRAILHDDDLAPLRASPYFDEVEDRVSAVR